MTFFEAIFLGVIQGLTEFIPISSSGHMDIIPRVLGLNHPSTVFIWFVHIGTLLALLYYYRNLILRYLKTSFKFLAKRKKLKNREEKELIIIRNIILTIIPAVVIGVIFESIISEFYENTSDLKVVGLAILIPMLLIGILFIFEKRLFKNNKKTIDDLSKQQSLLMGLAQTLAFIRGVSRSGITLLAGQALGLKRIEAAELSFLMSIPIIAGTSIYSIYKLLQLPQEQIMNELNLGIVGLITAFISGLIAVKFLLKFLQRNSLQIFGIYRILLALILLGIIFL